MSRIDVGKMGPIRLDELMALNDEMAALVRAGVPLDRGLLALGTDLRGRPGQAAQRLSVRLERGESLDRAIEGEGSAIPGFYRSVVAAGIRSGRLASALEGLARNARHFDDTRRAIGMALLYPLMVLMLGVVLFMLLVILVTPRFAAVFMTFRLAPATSLKFLLWMNEHIIYWAPVVPVLMLVLAWAWWSSGRASRLRPGQVWGLFRMIPGLRSILEESQAGDFAGLLSLLMENGVPLDEAIGLAANATGSHQLKTSANDLAEGLRRGESLADLAKRGKGLPAMLVWVLSTAGTVGTLVPALSHAAETYRHRALRRAETIRGVVPALFLCVIGATTAGVYLGSVLFPMLALWKDLAIPINE